MDAADEPLEHVVLKTKFTELDGACRCAEGVVPYSMIDVADFVLARVSAPGSCKVSSNDTLPHTA